MIKKIGPQTIIPLVIGAASIMVMWLLIQWHGCTVWSVECWKRWDSFHYLTIASDGYTLVPCEEQGGWCGNTGWAPLYPWLIRYIAPIFGLKPELVGVLLSSLFFIGYLMIGARLLKITDYKYSHWLNISLFAFFPGCTYFLAIFPISLVVFLAFLVLYSLEKSRLWLVGITAGLIVFSYSPGMFIIIPLGAYYAVKWFAEKEYSKKHLIPIALCLLITTLFFAYFEWRTGQWNALFLIQGKYGHYINTPWKMVGWRVKNMMENQGSPVAIIELFSLFYMAMAVWLLIEIIIAQFKSKLSPFLSFILFFLLAFWVLPYSMSAQTSSYRFCVFLSIPFLLICRKPKLWLQIMLLIGFLISCYQMTGYFFDKSLI